MDIFIVKDNLVDSLCSGLVPHILDGFVSIYEDSVRVNPKKPHEQYKRFLLDIKLWPPNIITAETKRIVALFKTLRKVVKTINYINIKSLSLIGRHNIHVDDDYISKHTPSVDNFIHMVYMNSAKEFFHDDSLMNYSVPGTRLRQSTIVEAVIKQLLHQFVPISELLHNINDDTDITLLDNTTDTEQTKENNDTDSQKSDVNKKEEKGQIQSKKQKAGTKNSEGDEEDYQEGQEQEDTYNEEEEEEEEEEELDDEMEEQTEEQSTMLHDEDDSILIPVQNHIIPKPVVTDQNVELSDNISNSLFTDAKTKYVESETNENGIGALVEKMPELNLFSGFEKPDTSNVTLVTPRVTSRPMISLRNKAVKKPTHR